MDSEEEEEREELRSQEFYACAGYCVTKYQQIEDAISGLFYHLLGAEPQKAGAVWREVRGLDSKRKVIANLFALAGDSPFCEQWNEISRRIKAAQEARDEIAHGALTIFGGGISVDLKTGEARRLARSQLELHKAIRGAAPSRWDIERMREEGQRLDALYSDLLNLIMDLRER